MRHTTKPTRPFVDNPEPVIERPILAQAIVDLSAAAEKLLASGLNRKAIIVLLHDATKQGKREIEYVLNALESLAHDYTQ